MIRSRSRRPVIFTATTALTAAGIAMSSTAIAAPTAPHATTVSGSPGGNGREGRFVGSPYGPPPQGNKVTGMSSAPTGGHAYGSPWRVILR
ncbi:hypothetical protein [Streptomyces sp. 147326]|uniref:hypothetical protein n=1 Tax=Streptomyces sp. 147326 TaxID=3074379 RepID=UPI0038576B61